MFTVNETCDGLRDSAGPIYSSLGADPAIAELVALFVEELPSRVVAIRQAVGHEEWNQVRVLAHQLKGAGGSYGFHEITAAAGWLESLYREQPGSSEALAVLDAFAAVCDRIRAGDAPA